MKTQPALRILLLYMLGIALYRWAFHSFVMDEKAMHAGKGAVLMVLAAQLLITLYLPTFVSNNKIFWGQDRIEFALKEANK